MMKSWLVYPSPPTGNNRRIELPGRDLFIPIRVDNVFVYPFELNIDRLNDALGHTLSIYPFIAGHFLVLDDEHYVIEMSDNGIPVSFVENIELSKWPLDENALRDTAEGRLPAFVDALPSAKMTCNSLDEPLFRLKVTHIVQSDEWVMGTSWSHILGDGYGYANFLHTLSRFYQHLEPLKPLPVFERRIWRKDEADQSCWPLMRHLTESVTAKQRLEIYMTEQLTHDQLNMHFSGEQLATLRKLVLDSTLSRHDVMIAYIILTLNVNCFSNDEQLILHTNIIVNYHGVSDSIAPSNLIANCTLRVLSDNFEDPYSLSSIAKSIRQSIVRSRDPKFLERWIATSDQLMKDMARNNRLDNMSHFSNGLMVNSVFRCDWADLVDFGHTDKCRFYTDGTRDLYLRVFRLNPIYDGTQWKGRDREGAEVALRIEKSIKTKFINAWQQDAKENFSNVKI